MDPIRLLSMIVVLASSSSAAAAGPLVASFVPPTRRSDGAQLAARAREVAREVASRLGGQFSALEVEANPEITPRLARALALAEQGSLDEAASTLDVALATAAAAPQRAGAPARLFSAHLDRVAIALARGETRRAEELLSRLLRYDPTFELRPEEDSPRLRRALADSRRRLGSPPSLDAPTLGTACQAADILIVARCLELRTEFSRFDHCKLVGQATVGAGWPVALVADRLAGRALPGQDAPVRRPRTAWAPWVLGGAGLALAVAGAVLAGLGARDLDGLEHSPCGQTRTCDPAGYAPLERRQNGGWGLLAAGSAGLVSAVIWKVVQLRTARREAERR